VLLKRAHALLNLGCLDHLNNIGDERRNFRSLALGVRSPSATAAMTAACAATASAKNKSADALAADYDLPILRGSSQPPAPVVTVGPATFTRWSGFYFGGNVSLGSATSDFHCDAAAGSIQLAAPDNRRPGAPFGFSGPQ
jgi:hypothetical protein